jgi:hypothetical protein
MCMAVGQAPGEFNLAMLWNGTSWRALAPLSR